METDEGDTAPFRNVAFAAQGVSFARKAATGEKETALARPGGEHNRAWAVAAGAASLSVVAFLTQVPDAWAGGILTHRRVTTLASSPQAHISAVELKVPPPGTVAIRSSADVSRKLRQGVIIVNDFEGVAKGASTSNPALEEGSFTLRGLCERASEIEDLYARRGFALVRATVNRDRGEGGQIRINIVERFAELMETADGEWASDVVDSRAFLSLLQKVRAPRRGLNARARLTLAPAFGSDPPQAPARSAPERGGAPAVSSAARLVSAPIDPYENSRDAATTPVSTPSEVAEVSLEPLRQFLAGNLFSNLAETFRLYGEWMSATLAATAENAPESLEAEPFAQFALRGPLSSDPASGLALSPKAVEDGYRMTYGALTQPQRPERASPEETAPRRLSLWPARLAGEGRIVMDFRDRRSARSPPVSRSGGPRRNAQAYLLPGRGPYFSIQGASGWDPALAQLAVDSSAFNYEEALLTVIQSALDPEVSEPAPQRPLKAPSLRAGEARKPKT